MSCPLMYIRAAARATSFALLKRIKFMPLMNIQTNPGNIMMKKRPNSIASTPFCRRRRRSLTGPPIVCLMVCYPSCS